MAKVPPPTSPTNNPTVKRGPSAPLSGSSSEDDDSYNPEAVPPSPCSSTSSGYDYVRPAGFSHHAQEIRSLSKKSSHASSLGKQKKKARRNVIAAAELGVPDHAHQLGMPDHAHQLGMPDQAHQLDMPDHAHQLDMPDHAHQLDMPDHTHQLGMPDHAHQLGMPDHAHQLSSPEIQKYKDNNNNNNKVSCAPPGRIATKQRLRVKNDPLPMKDRALPQSYWQQPTSINAVSPGSMYSVLPKIAQLTSISDITEIRPVTPPSDQEGHDQYELTIKPDRLDKLPTQEGETKTAAVPKPKLPRPPAPRQTLRDQPNSHNLMRRLFTNIEHKPVTVNKRGRPKKHVAPSDRSNKHLTGDDPYMIDAIAEPLHVLPMLSIESNRQSIGPSSHLSLVPVRDGNKTLMLPSLSVELNYPLKLQEIVKAL